MSTIGEEFVKSFHNLEGISLSDRKRNVCLLFHNYAPAFKQKSSDLDYVIANLIPKTFLVENFYLDFLIYFQQSDPIFAFLLKTGERTFITKIMKQLWFVKDFLVKMPIEDLSNALPQTSTSLRLKIFWQLSLYSTPEHFDDIFDMIVNKYGICTASQYICGCTSQKIKGVLTDYDVKISTKQYKILYERDPGLAQFSFKNVRRTHTKRSASKCLFRRIYFENRALYDHLVDKCGVKVKFGRRTSRRILERDRDDIVKNIGRYKNLSLKILIRHLGRDSVAMFKNALPETFSEISSIRWLVEFFPLKHHQELYLTVIEGHYPEKFSAHPELLNDSFLKMLNDEERARFAEVAVNSGREQYLKYLKTSKSVPLLMKKIQFCADNRELRVLLSNLLETCAINKELGTLLEVLEFLKRQLNVDDDVKFQIMGSISRHFKTREFSRELWESLNQLMPEVTKVDRLNFFINQHTILPVLNIQLVYADFLVRNGSPIDAFLEKYFEVYGKVPHFGYQSLEFERKILLYAIHYTGEKEVGFDVATIEDIHRWNLKYPDERIDFFDYKHLADTFENIVKNNSGLGAGAKSTFRDIVFGKLHHEKQAAFLEVYFDRFGTYGRVEDLLWFLNKDYRTILRFLPKILGVEPKHQFKFWHTVKKWGHVGLDRSAIELAKSRLLDEKCLQGKTNIVECLSVILQPEEFVKIVTPFKPPKKNLDFDDEGQVKLYNLQSSIAFNFKNVQSYGTFDVFFEFCGGDFLTSARTSLHCFFWKLPESLLGQHLGVLTQNAIALRKQALFLACNLGSVSNLGTFLQDRARNEDVETLQRQIFMRAMKAFTKNPTKDFFDLLKLTLKFVKEDDEEVLRCLQGDDVPRIYKSEFIQYMWSFVETVFKDVEKAEDVKSFLIRNLDEATCQKLPLDFGLQIIEAHFLTSRPIYGLHQFIINFVSNHPDFDLIFQKIFTILEAHPKEHTITFFNVMWSNCMRRTSCDFLEPFVRYFDSKLDLPQDFQEHVKLFFLKLQIEGLGQDQLMGQIYPFFKELSTSYGSLALSMFAKQLREVYVYFFEGNEQETSIFSFYYNLIVTHPEIDVAELIIENLYQPHYKKGSIELFWKILGEIRKLDDNNIRFILKSKFQM